MTNPSEQKFAAIIRSAPLGLAEFDENGIIAQMSYVAEAIFSAIKDEHRLDTPNFYELFVYISTDVVERVKQFTAEEGLIILNEVYHAPLCLNGVQGERYFNISGSKIAKDCFVVSFDDITEKRQKEQAMKQVELDRALMQGKFEIASDILHDIGNAVVGFGSYLTRIKRVLEQNNLENLENLAAFFAAEQALIAGALGADRAGAVTELLTHILQTQNDSREEIRKSITEQLNIISHIQEILNIQRQYVKGHESQERAPVNLRSVINDCLAMLFASSDKRGIALSLAITAEHPVVKGDRTKLMQVVLNILKNGIEAITEDSVEKNITIQVDRVADSIVLKVTDTGCGFDTLAAEKIFKRGFTTKTSGTGLGLYNCRSIIESHGGTMAIFSAGPKKGATVTIKLNIEG